MVGLGGFVACNGGGIADGLSQRYLPVRRSTSAWRATGAFLAVIGAGWSLALLSAF
jgi:hypothetical protein